MPANQALLCMFGGILIRHYIDADQSETCTLWSLSACRRLQICVWMRMCPCALLICELVHVFALRKAEKVSGKWRSGQGEKYVWRVLPHRNTEWLFNPTFSWCYISNHKHGCKLHAQTTVRFFQTFPAACRPGNFLKLWIIAMLSGRHHCSALARL